jgi:putative ABC transport system permease protein
VFTLIFGLIPVLLTMRVRPAIILRPNENHVPAMGCFTTAGALSVIVLTIGVIVGSIVRNIPVGIIGVTVVLLIFGLLLVMMWVIVWLIGKLPSFGNVDLRLALRNLSTRRWRTAITLLALSAGMYALSILSLSAQGISEILRFQFANQLGGNVMVFSLASVLNEGIGQGLLDFEIGRLEGVENVTRIYTSTVRAVSVNGEDAQAIMRSNMPNIPGNRGGRFSPGNFLVVMIRDISNTDTVAVTSGRALTAEDRGENVIVVPNDGDWEWLGLQVGDVITVQQGGRNVDLTVVGTVEGSTLSMFNGTAYVPVDVLPAAENFPLTILRVAPEHLNQALIDLTANPVNLALDITFIDGLIGRLINQFAALPTVVGLLSLLAAATIMANTVALATLERRRQIGILKAVGLKGSRVLRIMLLENTLIGLLGALLGVGLSALFVAIMTQLSTGIAIPVPRESTLTVLALIAAAVGIAWLATFLSARQAAGERVLNVLRYE